ncbi:hypothetical protein Aduo_015857 [Ancylostoma duodenale]
MSAPTIVAYFLVFVLSVHSIEANGSGDAHSRSKRLAIHPSQWALHLWPGGVVPYDIASHYTDWEKAVILSGMAEFPKHTCISFRPRTASDKYYLAINKYYDLERCFSYIGRQTTFLFRTAQGNIETRMKLDPSCLRFNGRGTVMHELMHILGFYHEHQRDDRDPRVTGSASHYNYKVYPRSSTFYMGPYDRTSIMHYNFPGIVYPRSYFSASDILRINTLYRNRPPQPQRHERPLDHSGGQPRLPPLPLHDRSGGPQRPLRPPPPERSGGQPHPLRLPPPDHFGGQPRPPHLPPPDRFGGQLHPARPPLDRSGGPPHPPPPNHFGGPPRPQPHDRFGGRPHPVRQLTRMSKSPGTESSGE